MTLPPTASVKAGSSKPDLAALAILALAVVGAFGVLPSLATTDLNWCYPYMGPDSWDWLVERPLLERRTDRRELPPAGAAAGHRAAPPTFRRCRSCPTSTSRCSASRRSSSIA